MQGQIDRVNGEKLSLLSENGTIRSSYDEFKNRLMLAQNEVDTLSRNLNLSKAHQKKIEDARTQDYKEIQTLKDQLKTLILVK